MLILSQFQPQKPREQPHTQHMRGVWLTQLEYSSGAASYSLTSPPIPVVGGKIEFTRKRVLRQLRVQMAGLVGPGSY